MKTASVTCRWASTWSNRRCCSNCRTLGSTYVTASRHCSMHARSRAATRSCCSIRRHRWWTARITRFQLLVDHVIRAVHHRCRRIEQHDLVAALDLACIEQCLLAVTYVDPKVLQFEQHRRFDHIDPQRHVTDAVFIEHGLDLERRSLDQASDRGNRSA